MEKCEGFIVGAAAEKVVEAGTELALVGLVPAGDFLRDRFEGIEVSGWIALAPIVIGNGFESPLEQADKFRVRHAGRVVGIWGIWNLKFEI